MKKLYLSDSNKKLGGVCGGIGEYFDVDPTLVRIIFIIATLASIGLGIIAYILMWIVIPKESKEQGKN
ncbi:MAG: PspC domain-containing protein [Candidatus Omnitrophota bacterium]